MVKCICEGRITDVMLSSLSLGEFNRRLEFDESEVIVKVLRFVRGMNNDLRHVPGHLSVIQIPIVILIVEITQQY